MKIAIGTDHIGFEIKQTIIDYVESLGHTITDFGCYSSERTDYPIYGEKAARAVAGGECELGILICGTGIGISLAANKVNGIRAAVCSEVYSAIMARQHNNANMIAFGARVIGIETAKMIVSEFLKAEYEGGRHQKRVDMITEIEAGEQMK